MQMYYSKAVFCTVTSQLFILILHDVFHYHECDPLAYKLIHLAAGFQLHHN